MHRILRQTDMQYAEQRSYERKHMAALSREANTENLIYYIFYQCFFFSVRRVREHGTDCDRETETERV